jgi:hypothetical protein
MQALKRWWCERRHERHYRVRAAGFTYMRVRCARCSCEHTFRGWFATGTTMTTKAPT